MRLVLCGVSWSRTDAFFQPKTWTSDNRQYLKAMSSNTCAPQSNRSIFFRSWSLCGKMRKRANSFQARPRSARELSGDGYRSKKPIFIVRVHHPFYKSAAGRRSRDPRTAARARLTC